MLFLQHKSKNMINRYKKRIVDTLLNRKLEGIGAVLIEGPKWCGKTTCAEQKAKSIVYMNDPKKSSMYMQLAKMSPQTLLEGESPKLIDEWQLAPSLWDTIRFEVDHRDGEGFFILTGSAVPARTDEIQHTGTGRFARIKMRPMSLWESEDSTGIISLGALFNGSAQTAITDEKSLEDMAFLVCRGGWPKATMQKKDVALERVFDYYDAVVNADALFGDESDNALNKILYIHPAMEVALRKDANFIDRNKFGGDVMASGVIGRIAGAMVRKSKRVKLVKYAQAEGGSITIVADGAEENETQKHLATIQANCIDDLKVGNTVNTVAVPYYACPLIVTDVADPNEAPEADSGANEDYAVTIYMKRAAQLETDRDILAKTTVISADEHYGVALSNDSKVVLAKFKA